jgi:putative flavoprotein involved in K+ transport
MSNTMIRQAIEQHDTSPAEPVGRDAVKNGQVPEYFDTVVIGAGQAGLAMGYYLARRGVEFVILDAGERVGDAWRNRWNSLKLFTPARHDSLPGLPFPAPTYHFPTKDQMGDYLEAYAAKFDLPVRTRTRVDRLSRRADRFVLEAGERRFEANNVVVAMSNYQSPRTPEFAGELDPAVVQLHSRAYRSPAQLREGGVLVVGAGNSGAEIAMEAARSHPTWMSGTIPGHIPFRIESPLARLILTRLVLRVLFHRVLTVSTPLGRKVRPKMLARGAPLIRLKPKDLAAAGITPVARTVGVREGRPLLADGSVLDVANVVWCTGHHPGFSWIDLPIFDEDGLPAHERGIVERQSGLYFVGLEFLYAFSSEMIHGVGRDAERIAGAISTRPRPVQAQAAGARRATAITAGRH